MRSLRGGKRMNIIVVIRNEPVAQTTVAVLERGLKVHVARFAKAEDALAVRAPYAEVFLVDYLLGPRMDGIQAVRKLREQYPNALIIGMDADDSTKEDFLEAGADGFFLKAQPRSPEVLIEMIETL